MWSNWNFLSTAGKSIKLYNYSGIVDSFLQSCTNNYPVLEALHSWGIILGKLKHVSTKRHTGEYATCFMQNRKTRNNPHVHQEVNEYISVDKFM